MQMHVNIAWQLVEWSWVRISFNSPLSRTPVLFIWNTEQLWELSNKGAPNKHNKNLGYGKRVEKSLAPGNHASESELLCIEIDNLFRKQLNYTNNFWSS